MSRKWITKDEGRFSDSLPEPFTEVTEHEFRHLLALWGIQEKPEIRTWFEGENSYRDTYVIYWFPQCGIAVKYPGKWEIDEELPGRIRYPLPERYFRLGCPHEWKELAQEEAERRGRVHHGRCYHVCYCAKCESYWEYDSSG